MHTITERGLRRHLGEQVTVRPDVNEEIGELYEHDDLFFDKSMDIRRL